MTLIQSQKTPLHPSPGNQLPGSISYIAPTIIGMQRKYRSSAMKCRIINLSSAFIEYLRADGIVLPTETTTLTSSHKYNDTSTSEGWDEPMDPDPSLPFAEIHQEIKDIIVELGGLVAPKLNWSAPKDATWISMTKNSMECASPNDIYLLLKSSDFITHDLEHAFDDTAPSDVLTKDSIKYVLVMRKWFEINPSCEFRCFVRDGKVVGICQRDLNHFKFLFPMIEKLRDMILRFYMDKLKDTFPEDAFVFDVYLPEPYDRVRLVDINPWAPRTDAILYSWLELLTMPLPNPLLGIPDSEDNPPIAAGSSDEDIQEDYIEELEWKPELRLVKEDDPEAYSFASPQYSAHKLPRDVVDAGLGGESGMMEFANNWKMMMEGGMDMQGPCDDSEDYEETVNIREI